MGIGKCSGGYPKRAVEAIAVGNPGRIPGIWMKFWIGFRQRLLKGTHKIFLKILDRNHPMRVPCQGGVTPGETARRALREKSMDEIQKKSQMKFKISWRKIGEFLDVPGWIPEENSGRNFWENFGENPRKTQRRISDGNHEFLEDFRWNLKELQQEPRWTLV